MVDTQVCDSYNIPSMINITNVFRVSLSAVLVVSSVALPVLYFFNDAIGAFMTACFSLAFFCLFYAYAIIPYLLDHKYIRIENKHYPISPTLVVVQREKTEAFAQYHVYARIVIASGTTLFVLGLIGFVVSH